MPSEPSYMSSGVTAPAVAQSPFYPGTNVMDPGRVSAGLPSQPVLAAAPPALSKGTQHMLPFLEIHLYISSV